jgi:hypothetical protein
MATKTASCKSADGQQKLPANLGSPGQAGLASGANAPSEVQAVYWGDRFAFQFWLACFALMGLMVGYDAITGLWRWMGGD